MDRDFKGVWVPKEIWLNKNLTILDKAIMIEIDSLDKGGQFGCWAGNEHFAEMFGCTTRKVSDAVSKLIKMGYVKVIGNDGRHRFLRSCMKYAFNEFYNCVEAGVNKFSSLPDEIFQSASRNFPPSNTYREPMSIDDIETRAREEDVNPYGDGDYRLPTGTVMQYATDNLKVMGYRASQELISFVDDLGEDVVRHAIDNALDHGVKTWGYVKTILNGYVDENVKTIGEAKELDEKFRKGKQKREQEPKTESKPVEEMSKEELDYALKHGPFGKFYY